MTLKDFEFSDLLLTETSPESCFFKGTPELGEKLTSVPSELHEEIHEFLEEIKASYKNVQNPFMRRLRVVHRDTVFRVAAFMDVIQGPTYFIRRLPEKVYDFTNLGIPKQVCEWLMQHEHSKGLLLFAGPQCAGKTTSANAFIKSRLTENGGHAVTFEHPVEQPLAGAHGENGHCWQCEITSETELSSHIENSHSFSSPNIIFIGEVRSKHAAAETLRAALGSSKQLVVATIHGTTISTALDRLLMGASELDGHLAHHNLAETLAGIVFQEIQMNKSLDKRTLDVKFLMVPFDERGTAIRSKLRKGDLFLDDEIREQKNKFTFDSRL